MASFKKALQKKAAVIEKQIQQLQAKLDVLNELMADEEAEAEEDSKALDMDKIAKGLGAASRVKLDAPLSGGMVGAGEAEELRRKIEAKKAAMAEDEFSVRAGARGRETDVRKS